MTTATTDTPSAEIIDPEAVLPDETPVDDAADEAAMLAGFAEATQATDATPTTTPAETDKAEGDATPAAGEAAPAEKAPEPKYVQVTDEQLRDLLAGLGELGPLRASVKKMADDFGGRVGGIEQWVKDLRTSTPAGQAIQVSDEDFQELKAEFPELTDMHVKGLNRVLSKIRGTGPAVSSDDLSQMISTQTQSLKQVLKTELAIEALAETHPDWVTVVGLPDQDGGMPPDTEYRRWLATQPKDYQDKVLNTFSPTVIGRSIDKFTTFKKDTDKKPPQSPAPGNARRAQLASAVTPKASSAAPPNPTRTEDDDIMDGFQAARGR